MLLFMCNSFSILSVASSPVYRVDYVELLIAFMIAFGSLYVHNISSIHFIPLIRFFFFSFLYFMLIHVVFVLLKFLFIMITFEVYYFFIVLSLWFPFDYSFEFFPVLKIFISRLCCFQFILIPFCILFLFILLFYCFIFVLLLLFYYFIFVLLLV